MRSAQSQTVVVGFIGVLAALAVLFGPAQRWLGVDVGATGAVIFVLNAGAAICLFALRGEEIFPDDMSVAERRAWVGLVFLAVILLSLARHLWAISAQAVVPDRLDQFVAHEFVQRLLTLIAVWAVISHLIGRGAGAVESDERDLRWRHRADRGGDWALTLIVIACICVLVSVPMSLLEWWLTPIVLANVLIGILIAKSFVEHLVLTYAYRAGRA
jgi:hypothetical protein